MNALMPRATIEQIVAFRNAALDLYATAYDKIVEADEAIKAAHEVARNASPGINSYTSTHEREQQAFHEAVKLPKRDQYLRTAKKLVDLNAWAYIIERTELERLMDAEAKDKLRSQMAYVPDRVGRNGELITDEEVQRGLPELTVENVQATIQQFMLDADMIFRRGIANVFSRLDRRFRSHDGFKIGSRMILSYVCDGMGHFHYGSRARDLLHDVERVFYVLEGEAPPSAGIVWQIEDERRGSWSPRQSEHESRYMRIVIYKNGNAHLWFTRKDLVERVNKLLAEYYGEVIGDGQTREDPFANVKHLPAKRFGFYPTPDDVVATVGGHLWLRRDAGEAPLRVLEPSAGTGQLARFAARERETYEGYGKPGTPYRALVDCVEIQPALADQLRAEGVYNRVLCQDFLQLQPAQAHLYDRVLMNPPFDLERDIDHVVHALKFLRPGGQLVAIMSAGTEFRETKKAIAFRELMASMKAEWHDLPAGSFSEAGTYVNTLFVVVKKPAS